MTDTAPSTVYLNVEALCVLYGGGPDGLSDEDASPDNKRDVNRLCDEIVSLRQQLAEARDTATPEFHVATDIAILPAIVNHLEGGKPLPMLRFEFSNPTGPLVPVHLIQNPIILRDLRMAVGTAIDRALKGARHGK